MLNSKYNRLLKLSKKRMRQAHQTLTSPLIKISMLKLFQSNNSFDNRLMKEYRENFTCKVKISTRGYQTERGCAPWHLIKKDCIGLKNIVKIIPLKENNIYSLLTIF
jgi:hypothetical protein